MRRLLRTIPMILLMMSVAALVMAQPPGGKAAESKGPGGKGAGGKGFQGRGMGMMQGERLFGEVKSIDKEAKKLVVIVRPSPDAPEGEEPKEETVKLTDATRIMKIEGRMGGGGQRPPALTSGGQCAARSRGASADHSFSRL